MSVLSAIETPARVEPNALGAAGPDLVNRERPLRVVGGPSAATPVPAADGAFADAQPCSSSILAGGSRPLAGRRGDPAAARIAARTAARTATCTAAPPNAVQAVPAPARIRPTRAAVASAPPRPARGADAGPVLTGTVVSSSRQQPRLAADIGMSRVPLRLTRRGRVVVAAVIVGAVTLAVLLITMLVSGGAQATNHGHARAGYQGMHQVVVRPGQTLWSIAAAAEPTADPRSVIQEIMTANALGSPTISAGQLLWVP